MKKLFVVATCAAAMATSVNCASADVGIAPNSFIRYTGPQAPAGVQAQGTNLVPQNIPGLIQYGHFNPPMLRYAGPQIDPPHVIVIPPVMVRYAGPQIDNPVIIVEPPVVRYAGPQVEPIQVIEEKEDVIPMVRYAGPSMY